MNAYGPTVLQGGQHAPQTQLDFFEATRTRNQDLARHYQHTSCYRSLYGLPLPEEQTECLKRILKYARSLTRSVDVSADCQIIFATDADCETASAGFFDAPHSFQKPFIFLQADPYEVCDREELLCVYQGLVLHETGHLRYTREGYRRRSGLSRLVAFFDNVWEDERIETRLRKDIRGYWSLLEACRQRLIVPHVLQHCGEWESLPDLDRLRLLIYAFVRCPELISAEMIDWQTFDGFCPFRELRLMFPQAPVTEHKVAEYAELSERLVLSMRKQYPETAQAFVDCRNHGRLDDRNSQSILKQLEADAVDRVLSHSERDLCHAVSGLLDEAVQFEKWGCLTEGTDSQGMQSVADRLLETAMLMEERQRKPEKWKSRFREDDLEALIHHRIQVTPPLSETDGQNATSPAGMDSAAARDVSEIAGTWHWYGERRTVIEYPSSTRDSKAQVETAREAVKGHAAALRRVFQPRARTATLRRGRRTGKIDRRRLWQGTFDDRIFLKKQSVVTPGISLCLLIDESGSMFQNQPFAVKLSRIQVARQVAIMIAEAVRGQPHIELEIYSHTSASDDKRHCAIRYLYGKQQPDLATLAARSTGGLNYDHQAVLTASELFLKETSDQNDRWMIVMTDGMPYGVDYRGEPAVEATRQSVRTVRQRGIQVLSVAIDDFHCEDIYGQNFTLKFTELGELVARMRRLVTTLAR